MAIEILALSRLHPLAFERLERKYTVHRYLEAKDPAALIESVALRVRAIATGGNVALTREMLGRFPKLEIVAFFGVGYDSVDVDAAKERGIAVAVAPHALLTADVADLATALLIALARGLLPADRHVRAGDWKRKGPVRLGTTVFGKTAGIVGLGRIGSETARRLEPLRLTVLYHDVERKPGVSYRYVSDLEAMARESDFLVVTCAGGAATRNLIDARILGALGPDGYLINVARGSVVDEPALVAALKAGAIKGAALDVFAGEPNVPEALMGLDNVILLPHMASGTRETREAMATVLADNIDRHFSGEPVVNRIV